MKINGFTPNEMVFETFNKKDNEKSTSGFSDILKQNLDSINEKQVHADEMTKKFVMGEDVEVHEVMLAAEEAKMSLQLAVQMRNKVVEAVQELTRMQL
ncbi:MAG: flagellar hook-basal body complex protein FliE [Clostridium sp.]